MHHVATAEPHHRVEHGAASDLDHLIHHAAHLLPAQGPITVFVHHNTLHAFEHLEFDEGVKAGASTYGCHPYLPEDYYRREVVAGRILADDLSAELIEDMGEDADFLIGFMGSRYHLRLAMLAHPLRTGTDAELQWVIAETDALLRFRAETPPDTRRRLVDLTRQWVLKDYAEAGPGRTDLVATLIARFGASKIARWDGPMWESFTLNLMWRICRGGVHGVPHFGDPVPLSARLRDLLFLATGRDSDILVHDLLVRFCAAFLDQGYAAWTLPGRSGGFFRAFSGLYRATWPVESWLRDLPSELARIEAAGLSPIESIEESLHLLGVGASEREEYVTKSLLALRGWAGMLWQMETNAEWTVHPAPPGTLTEFLAVRLILDRLAARYLARESLPGLAGDDHGLRAALSHHIDHPPRVSVDQRAYLVFQIAQVRGWSPADLFRLSKSDWSRLVREIESFSSMERRRTYHHAFERRYRIRAIDAVAAHANRPKPPGRPRGDVRPSFQMVTCIDDREESFRRHLEEVAPDCETFSAAGFYAVAMYYRSASDAHYRPLCPVVVKPSHFVREEAAYSLTSSSRQRAQTRRLLGRATRHWHEGSRTFLGGILTTMLGSFASIPMVTRILFPRLTSQIRRWVGSIVEPPPVTELQLLRVADPPGDEGEHLGYSYAEMCVIVERLLRDLGLTRGFSRLVLMVGHGSGSLNNPHESAYNCGACSGSSGGPNARAFAQMANDPRVRAQLARNGLEIPDDTWFLGAYHNTCDEDVVYLDLDRLPMTHRKEFEQARRRIDQARERNAHERCRRFESAHLALSPNEALEHVETRAEDLSQARPEYNHATNALCLVGRRSWSRGLYLDRRSFLNSYDPTQDDADHTILARILAAAVPVCAGINLEYYFSRVDEAGYGCGSKLPHNVTALLGVMEGAASDLRTGLSQQMVEIHEPLRILFMIETTPAAMLSIMDRNPTIGRLVRNAWVQMATLDPDDRTVHVFRGGEFQPYAPGAEGLPVVGASLDWYGGHREDLGFAVIDPNAVAASASPLEGEVTSR